MRGARRYASSIIALLAACNDPSAGDDDAADMSCTIVELPNGSTAIQCPDGTSTTIDPCWRGLADLDGDGAVTEADCGLIGVGAATRVLCSPADEWIRRPECRVYDVVSFGDEEPESYLLAVTHVDGGSGVGALVAGLRLSASGVLSYAVDRNRNGAMDELETTVVSENATPADTFLLPYRDVADAVKVAVVFSASTGVGSRNLNLWYDANGDGFKNEAVRGIAEDPSNASAALTSTGTLLVAYDLSNDAGTSDVWLWADANRNFEKDEGEVALVSEQSGFPTIRTGSSETYLAYYRSTDDAVVVSRFAGGSVVPEDTVEDGPHCGELNVIESYGGWVLECFDNDEQVVITHTWSAQTHVSFYLRDHPVTTENRLAHFYALDASSARLHAVGESGKLWVDTNGNWTIDDSELGPIPDGCTSISSDAPDRSFALGCGASILQLREPAFALYLGEQCNPAADTCAGSLVCRVSGEAAEPRCVPPQAS